MTTDATELRTLENLFRAGRYDEAVTVGRSMLTRFGDSVAVLNFVGSALHNSGRHAESEPFLARSLKLNGRQLEALVSQGQNKEMQGKFAEALGLFLEAARLTSGNAHVSYKIGAMHNRTGQAKEAIKFLNDALRLQPDFAEALAEMGAALMHENRRLQAVHALTRAVTLNPKLADSHARLGWLMLDLERPAQAVPHLQKALEIAPRLMQAHLGLGRACRDLHRNDEAMAHYRRGLELDPESATALCDIATMKTFTEGDPDLAQIERLAARPEGTMPRENRARLTCALGKGREDLGDFEGAAEAYFEGKRQMRALAPFSLERNRRFLERVKAVFDAPTIAAGRARGLRGVSPIFVAGLPRSGKTSVAAILGRHPRAVAEPEAIGISNMVEQMIPAADDLFDPASVQRMLLSQPSGAAETPDPAMPARISCNTGNFWTLGLIAMMFPEARIVHCSRDPMENALAIFRSTFSEPFLRYCDDLRDTLAFMDLYDGVMEHWREVLGMPIHEVRLDEIAAGGPAAQAALFEACGLDPAALAGDTAAVHLGTYLDNGLESYQAGRADARGLDPALVAAYASRVPALSALT